MNTASAPGRAMSARREYLAGVVLCALGAGLVLAAGGQTWAQVTVHLPAPLPSGHATLTGKDLAPAADGLGLAGLAALAGLVATRGLARTAIGVLLAVMGAAAAAVSVTGVRVAHVLASAEEHVSLLRGAAGANVFETPWWTVSLAGGSLLVAAGVLTAVRGRRWPAMSRRYDPPGARTAPESDSGALWDSLDHGVDPTVADADGTGLPAGAVPAAAGRGTQDTQGLRGEAADRPTGEHG